MMCSLRQALGHPNRRALAKLGHRIGLQIGDFRFTNFICPG